MRKKFALFALVLLFAVCNIVEGKVLVDRAGASKGGCFASVAIFWNDKDWEGCPLSHGATEEAKDFANEAKSFALDLTCHYYCDYEGFYMVALCTYLNGRGYSIEASYVYFNSAYSENLYNNDYNNYNSAKSQFDSLCAECYNEIENCE